ncbi:inositol monophosphatase family protein [Singulisphaera acidiphila]|uniref:Inositol-1-monophosphatase n=1 Tax=Singulisphaera acidiphila (strain ATCC BAA-1392 / DSM 18658 / VKM B-2454 / MOB10) TaxID=886293 RepID=L0DKN5_SINAD|nr:inositol monophosphatase family protein [Singulisphaera acidiphila]AGA29934.1 inositol monophosphatase/fructose-1,6-bisphosphatase family protein [Singulisphaera acidiphila DSM 18658]
MTTPELTVAEQAARAAGTILTRYFREGVTMRSKDISNLVSDADIDAERAIVEVIRRSFPGHEVMGEEEQQGDANAEHLWIVDPLDGTSNFAHKIPHFAVSIAYYHAGQPEVGVVFNPLQDDWITAVRGQGAFYNGERIQVADHTQLNEALVGVGFYYDRDVMMEATLTAISDLKRSQIHGIRRFGTASLDLCMVARGLFGAYFEYTLSPWDFAAGRLIVEEAGGRVTTCRGGLPPLAPTGILATNGALHEAMLEIVQARHPSESR